MRNEILTFLQTLPQSQPVDASKFVCYVYVIQKKYTSTYKIGKSIGPSERKFGLELGGSELDIIILIKLPNEEISLLWENVLHKMFEKQALGREWYNLSPNQVAFLKALALACEMLDK